MTYETFAIDVVRQAADLILRMREEGFDVSTKGGDARDLVTSIDLAVNEYVLSRIKESYPEHGIYSEESQGEHSAGSYQWTVDPIDGSANFSRGIPHFAICLGLLQDGVPVAAAILNPVTNELFSFTKGQGARLGGKPIRVSTVQELSKAQGLLSFGSRKKDLWDWAASSYRKSLEHMLKRVMLNSSSLDICFLAAGRADVCVYGTLSTLDIAPALGLLYEAGGVACDAQGNDVSYTKESQKVYLANNPTLLVQVRELFER
ncbi:MAG TPA: inositol monophosphatase [Candidatus Paceibacterota bacterium]|jgi:myo-inositol-1(or 4)-monophosphatase|nr:inositol monophosphatase [Candidatus Paceibacterota bacterium]